MKNEEFLRLLSGIDEKLIEKAGKDLENYHKTAPRYAAEGNFRKNTQKSVSAAVYTEAEKEDEVVMRPQYFRPDPSPKSGTTFKRVMIAAAAVVCVVAAGIFIKMNNKPRTVSPNESVSGGASENQSNSSPDLQHPEIPPKVEKVYEIDPIQLNEYLSKGYDPEKVKQYDKLNVYECSLMQLDKNAFLDFFSEPPTQNGNSYSTDSESGNFFIYENTKPEANENGEHFIMSYVSYHKKGIASYQLMFDYFDKETNEDVKTNVLNFATREKMEKTVRGVLSQFGDIEFQLTSRVVTSEEFSEASEKAPDINWGSAEDFYYVDGIMTVDGLPVTYGKNTYSDDNVVIAPTSFYAIYTENGLVDFELNNVWNVGGVISESEILTLEDAEKIIAEQYPPEGQAPRQMIFGKAALYYRASYTKDGLQLIPCWGFYVNDADPKITVNAITGEIL